MIGQYTDGILLFEISKIYTYLNPTPHISSLAGLSVSFELC